MLRACLVLCSVIVAATAAAQPVDKSVVEERLAKVTRDNSERMRTLQALFREAGCPQLTEAAVPRTLPNVVCTLPGETGRRILVGAHYDMTGPGLGVGDNWGSASLLPSLLTALKNERRKHTFVFIGFSDEEKGLVGAQHYVRTLSNKERSRIDAMINMDGVGMAATRVWHTRAHGGLLKQLHVSAKTLGTTVVEHSLDGAGIMDSFPFAEVHIPSLSLHGLAPGNYGIPHSKRDTLDAVDVDELYATYRLMVGYLLALDATRPTTPPAGRSR